MTTTDDAFDAPLGGLQVGNSRLRLSHTQMEAAIAEVRFVPGIDELSEAAAVAIWEALGTERFPVFDRHALNTVNLTLGPGGAGSTTQIQHGWILSSADRRTSITLLPSMVALQTSDYDRYSTSIGLPMKQAVDIFVLVTGASIVQRIGLRYINRLQDTSATHPTFWADHVQPQFAGPLAGPVDELVEATQQHVVLRLDDNSAARIISGAFREEGSEPRYSFLVDLDVFREKAFAFNPDLCAGLARQLNRTAFALFRRVLSDKHFQLMGPVELEGGVQ